jgi:TRAP-type C4-dicarboxylate transport system permease small subunit
MRSSITSIVPKQFLSGILKNSTKIFSKLSGAILFIMMMLTAADVALRYFFDMPIPGAYELTQFAMVVFVVGGLSCCGIKDDHISIDLIYKWLPGWAQTLSDCLAKCIGSLIIGLMAWQSFSHMKIVYDLDEKSQVLSIPAFPFYGITGLGIAFFALILISQFIELLLKAVKR